jgi:tungstate transport system ATP-binding protein
MALIEVTGLVKEYNGPLVLKGIDLEIHGGEVFTLIGPTGAGKTTLIRILDLIEPPSAGSIRFYGDDVGDSKGRRLELRRRMAYVQQKPIVFNTSVHKNVSCGLRWRHERRDIARKKVNRALELVGLDGYGHRNARELSGGEIQRVALARALVTEPDILFLDEPTANLDPVSTNQIEDLLSQIIESRRITVLMTTHDMSQGHRFATRIGVIMCGELVQVAPPHEVFNAPKNRQIGEFIGITNILAGRIARKDGGLATINVHGKTVIATSEHSEGDEVEIFIRPEDIVFTHSMDPGGARNIFDGTIVEMIQAGSLIRIEVDCGFPLLGVLTANSARELDLTVGKRIHAGFRAEAVHVVRYLR